MFGRKKKRLPDEEQLQRAVLQAAFVGKATEQETAKVCSQSQLSGYLSNAFKRLGVQPDKSQQKLAIVSVGALMLQTDFFKEMLEEGKLPDFDNPLPTETRELMMEAIQRSVEHFVKENS